MKEYRIVRVTYLGFLEPKTVFQIQEWRRNWFFKWGWYPYRTITRGGLGVREFASFDDARMNIPNPKEEIESTVVWESRVGDLKRSGQIKLQMWFGLIFREVDLAVGESLDIKDEKGYFANIYRWGKDRITISIPQERIEPSEQKVIHPERKDFLN
jgi:hypothetical protein